ncbi:MAG: General secretion pathway protein G [Candidatus Gottesmanbacteria bacterium GW2011_GWB1_44_11c]|uniref:General secretion pathway protein G n=2 Tax=Candidatus Gottesmaniibacteriota TaxID=1752720 RepID=A0A0G1IKT9_9BACT|nr:MAG: General secretion pathway protein G [Candidatus Gottesmanbacteria bacterium GW2011_GWB1_44_11c]KKT59775.1 MAG: General secretion pathway protein G [Candidatus Gottesmanbacteria bacterium GW2011_GWA1_44_24b]
MDRKKQMRTGFSLIELLVAIAIMAVLIALVLPNYLGARERARDTKLKAEMNQLKNAMRMYYNDYQRYPAPELVQGQATFYGCGANGTSQCIYTTPYPCPDFWFAAGGTGGCGTVYMKKPPTLNSGNGGFHYYQPDSDKFMLCVDYLENRSDLDAAVSRDRCAGMGISFISTSTHFCVCSD